MGTKLNGVAVIVASSRRMSRDGDSMISLDLGANIIGRRRYDLTLEVRVPSMDPYEVAGVFRVPRRVENIGWFRRGEKLEVGLELPVAVDPGKPLDVDVDWGAFEAAPGPKAAMEAAQVEAGRRMLGKQYARKHKL